MLKNYLDLKQILWKTILKSFFGKIKTCGKISWKSKCKSQRAENCSDILWIVMQTPVPKFYTLVPNWKKVRNTQELSPSAQWISVKGNMKHSETFTLRKTKVIFFQMEAWNTHKLSLSGNEIFSSGSMKHSELLTPRKMDMNNSHMETWWILTFRKMKMKILTLGCMLCVVQERKTWPTNILKSFRRQDAHMFFFNVWCSVLRTRKRICVSHNKGYTLLFQCVLFFPQCLALCEKNERYQMNKWMFFKMTDDVMPAVFFTKTCAVYDKQMELIILRMFLMACAGFWLRKTYDILRSGTLWRLLKKMNFCWPFFPINFVVSWFIDYCSLPVLASRNEHACETPPHGFWTIAN